MSRSTVSLALVATAFVVVNARPAYVARIPNGDNVSGVAALGHVDPAGGGANNDFGLDFATAGEQWTPEFCQQDSDGDGQTNGQELGDPCCQWVQSSNAVLEWTEGVSHPGDASSTSDASLWAAVTCGSSTSNSTAPTTGSSSITAEAGSAGITTNAGSTGTANADSTGTADATASASSDAATTSAPSATTAPSGSSAASALSPLMYSAVGVVSALVAFFL